MNPQNIADSIHRYISLRKHQDINFKRHTDAIEKWRMQYMAHCYKPLMSDPSYNLLLQYYFEKIYSGIDLSELSEAKLALKFINRVFTGTDMLHAALEFNAITGEINQALAEYIFEEKNTEILTEELYSDACHKLQIVEKLDQQISCFEDFAKDINSTLSNKVIYTSIKIARLPAKLAGCSNLYRLVSDGFETLRKIDNPEKVAETFISHERSTISRLSSKIYPVYIPITPDNI